MMSDEQNSAEADESLKTNAGQLLRAEQIEQIVEAALLASEGPLTIENLFRIFALGELDAEEGRKQIRAAIEALQSDCEDRGVELQKVASGYRYQTRQDLSPWVSRLWEEKPPRYTRALLETLALVAYKQPVTRGDIEQVRGVSVSQNIMRTLLERDWIRVVGQREAPGRPSMYGTTKAFLDYFNLSKLEALPPLEEIKAMIEPTLVADEGAPSAGPDVQDRESRKSEQSETESREIQPPEAQLQASDDAAEPAGLSLDNAAEEPVSRS